MGRKCASQPFLESARHTLAGHLALPQVVVQKSAATLYAATIDNKLAMKVGSADWSPADGNVQVSPHFLSCVNGFFR